MRDPGTAQWQACVREVRPWHTNPDQRGPTGGRPNLADRMLTQITVEIPGTVAHRSFAVPSQLADLVDQATAAAARVEGRAEALVGLGDLLTRSEAVASSRIERVYAETDDLARAAVGARASASARSTIAAQRALGGLAAVWTKGEPSQESVLDAHRELLEGDLLERQYAGRYRPMQNWIGESDFSPRDAVHVPPPPGEVPRLMDDLLDFARRVDMPVVVQAGLLHGQFEAIHPFTDGNGRIGRALIGAIMRRRSLTSVATLPVAAAMLSDVDGYFAALTAYRQGDALPLVTVVARSTLAAALASIESADRLSHLPEAWHNKVSTRRGSATRSLIDALLAVPVLDIARAQAACQVSPRRAFDALDSLTKAGVLEEATGGARSRIWIAVDVMDELANLEQRIGYRARPATA